MYPPHSEGIGAHSSNIFHMPPLPKLQVSLCHGVPGAAIVGTGSKIDRLSSRPHYGQGNLRARLAWLWFGCDTERGWMVNTVGARPVALKTSTFTLGEHPNTIGCLASRPWFDDMEEVLCKGRGDHHKLGTEALGR